MTTKPKTKTSPRPPRLTRAANMAFRNSGRCFFPVALACDIAIALNGIKSNLRTPERYRAWLRDHFEGTPQDARDCLLIARHWDTKKLKQAIAKAPQQDSRGPSIRDVAALLRDT
jgi:hypothetical protein